ncbi:hypothetical protein OS175_14200 [Marinicella sp. S1101]|uniref:hypothetical protein n=1 Tax=Marinicella marina TaxID=2996016 RepID=UPI002260EA60|nr:hypothetical protein [Marinicella marina]MCX7555024.1 hypothetical protein [Marinicella marina]MDJ1141312.1 hypothetical protein [Marinicella marina]
MSEFLSSHELLNLEDELRSANQPLYVHKNSNDGLDKSIKSLSLRTGWACYLWTDGLGLQNLKSTEPPAPKTGEFKEAIRFALERKHFSVFVFPINGKDAWLDAKLFFSRHTPELNGVVKFMFILPKEKNHKYFMDFGKIVTFNMGLDGNFVLRDGQWVSANDLP